MTGAEETLLIALLQAVPGIATWLGKAFGGDDSAQTRRVKDILPEKSNSEMAVEVLRKMQTPSSAGDSDPQ